MKKYFLVALMFFVFNNPASALENNLVAANTEPSCNGKIEEGLFLKRFDCSGGQKELYFIDNAEVTKLEFDKKKAIFDEKGELCTETIKSKSTELPMGFSASCTKGSYGNYYVAGKKVKYKVFQDKLISAMHEHALGDMYINTGAELKKQQKELSTYKRFVASFKSPESALYSSFPKMGQVCKGDGTSSIILNGEGYKTTCVGAIITEVEYYLANKKVTFEVYTKKKYKILKSANKQALKDWKKQK